MTKLTSLFLALGIALMPLAAGAETLTAGANIGNVPWEFQDANGDVVGFEVDLLREVGKRMGYDEVDIQNIPFQGLFAAVQSGRIDVAISSITITPERLGSVSFAQPYYDSDQSLTVRAGTGIASTADLEGKVVGVDTGSTGDMYVTQREGEWKVGEVRRYEGLNPAMLDLQAGRLDAYVSDIPALEYFTKDRDDLEVVERLRTGEQYSMMFAKDSPLTAKASDVITQMKGDGSLAALHEKWFGSAPAEGTSTAEVRDIPAAK